MKFISWKILSLATSPDYYSKEHILSTRHTTECGISLFGVKVIISETKLMITDLQVRMLNHNEKREDFLYCKKCIKHLINEEKHNQINH